MPDLPIIQRSRRHANPPGMIYVGRGSRWGNPYKVGQRVAGQELSAWAACHLYREWIDGRPHLVDELAAAVAAKRAKGLDPYLSCWCDPTGPEPCHAQTLAALLEDWAERDA